MAEIPKPLKSRHVSPQPLKTPDVNLKNDRLLIMMVPTRTVKVHPAITNEFEKIRIWVPAGVPAFELLVKTNNPKADVWAMELDLEGCRKLMNGMFEFWNGI